MSDRKSFGANVEVENRDDITIVYVSNNLDGKTAEDVRKAFEEIDTEKSTSTKSNKLSKSQRQRIRRWCHRHYGHHRKRIKCQFVLG